MQKYDIIENYRDDDNLRRMFLDFVPKVFGGLDFEPWYNKGFWFDQYIPFSIIQNNRIVSNVSVTVMNILLDGKEIDGIQFATVGTLPEYRMRGLSRYLMDYVLNKYNKETRFFFLFANEDVIDFYPRFGFKRYREVEFIRHKDIPKPAFAARKLDINSTKDFELICGLLKDRQDITRIFGARNYDFVTVWHYLNIFPNRLYYLEDDDILIVASEKQGILHLWDIVFRKSFHLQSAISKVMGKEPITAIHFHFPPDRLPFTYDSVVAVPDDSPLFVRGDFPVAGQLLKFPLTAQT